MHAALPSALAARLAGLLEGVSRKDLAARAEKMSAAYRQGQTSHALATRADALAYAMARMPATFAACAAILARLEEAMPDFAPRTLLDVGAGTGAGAWAAAVAWPGIAVTMLDRNPALRDLARELMPEAQVLAGDLITNDLMTRNLSLEKPKADLVMASYVLAELPEQAAAAVAVDLWRSADAALVLIEPGTPQGFARIRSSRAALIAAGAHVAAPCTHDAACPMAGSVDEAGCGSVPASDPQKDWCHFSQRLPRSRDHMLLKAGSVPFEDERYSYVAVTRQKLAHGARILSVPLEEKPGLTFKLCSESGLHAHFVPARDKDETRRVRRKGWGDLL